MKQEIKRKARVTFHATSTGLSTATEIEEPAPLPQPALFAISPAAFVATEKVLEYVFSSLLDIDSRSTRFLPVENGGKAISSATLHTIGSAPGGTLKPVTEKQLRRRQEILSAARQLLSDAGYAGVTMRGLAKRCGVSTKLLYDVYGNKDALLASAVSERLMLVYQAIETGNREQGVDHLMMLASGIADAMLELPNFAHVYATGMASGHGTYTRDDFSLPLIRKCLIEIRKNGELPEEQNLDLLAILLRMQFRAVIMHWNVNTIADDTLHMFMQLGVCNVLKTTTTGGSKVQLLDIEIQLLKQISARHHI